MEPQAKTGITEAIGAAGGVSANNAPPTLQSTGAENIGRSPPSKGASGSGKPPRNKKLIGKFDIDYGTAKMKSYPVTKGELFTVGGLGFGASIFFSAGAACISFSVDTQKDLDLTTGVKPEVFAYWDAMKDTAIYGGIVAACLGLALLIIGALNINSIIKRTTFDEE